eukprot:scaffold4014_cov86-Skeletonema_dohrnii-CCMP3373.AAC.2
MNYLRAVQPAGWVRSGRLAEEIMMLREQPYPMMRVLQQYNNKRWLDHSEVDCYAFAEEVTSEPLLALLH